MPTRDGTGSLGQGFLTGGRCGTRTGVSPSVDSSLCRGKRHQLHTTGLTGWQRAARASQQAATDASESRDPLARLERHRADIGECMERHEALGRS